MNSHAPIRRVFRIAAVCGLVLLSACGDDQKITIEVAPDRVQVRDEADGQPVAGIKVVLMDIRTNVPVAGPEVSGPDGYFHYDINPAGNLRLLAFGGVDYRIHTLPDYWYWKKGIPVSTGPGALTGPALPLAGKSDPSPPVTTVSILVAKVTPDSLPRIAGRVVDAVSGDPLGRVFVSLSPYLTGYQGNTSASDDVTLDNGLFSVSQIPFAAHPVTGNLFQINPLRFARQGYRPVIWSYDPPNGSDNVDIRGVTIAMTPVDDGDTGSITGRLLRDGLPAEGIAVGLGVVDLPATDKAGAGLPGWAAVTDQDGVYTMVGLPAGTYLLQPGFPLGDGAFFPNQTGNVPRKVEPGQAVDVGDLIVLHEIDPRFPFHGSWQRVPPTILEWSPVPGAATYEVHLNGEILPPTETNTIDLPESLVLSPGLHRWSVLALDKNAAVVGATQLQLVFRLTDPLD